MRCSRAKGLNRVANARSQFLDGLPAGQTRHYAGPSANGWVVVAVWESKEIWEKFRDETLLPAVQTGTSVLPGLPKTTEFEAEVEL